MSKLLILTNATNNLNRNTEAVFKGIRFPARIASLSADDILVLEKIKVR